MDIGDQVKILDGSEKNKVPYNVIGTTGKVISLKTIQNVVVAQVETPDRRFVINTKYLKKL